jgi:hypothetical protein
MVIDYSSCVVKLPTPLGLSFRACTPKICIWRNAIPFRGLTAPPFLLGKTPINKCIIFAQSIVYVIHLCNTMYVV